MTDPQLPTDAELERIVDQVQTWPTPALGQMIGALRPSVESGEAGEGTRLAVAVLCDVLAQRKQAA